MFAILILTIRKKLFDEMTSKKNAISVEKLGRVLKKNIKHGVYTAL